MQGVELYASIYATLFDRNMAVGPKVLPVPVLGKLVSFLQGVGALFNFYGSHQTLSLIENYLILVFQPLITAPFWLNNICRQCRSEAGAEGSVAPSLKFNTNILMHFCEDFSSPFFIPPKRLFCIRGLSDFVSKS